jgi:pyruvate dehydrogenase E2 component (dihydrolipoamide acetyltransferase)
MSAPGGAAEGAATRPASTPRLVPPRTRAYALAKGLTDAELGAIPSAGKLLPADIDAHLAHRGVVAAAGSGYRDHKISATQRALVYRLRRSATLVIPGSIAVEIPWSWLTTDRNGSEGAKPTAFQVFGHTVAQVATAHPKFRSVMQNDDTLREYDRVNVGLALARPNDELITAVVKGADQLTLAEFVRACGQQMRAAIREGDQATEDTQILLTHLGEFGIVDAVPTPVAPASSVFFLGAPKDGAGIARIVVTFDHRLINGASAGRFLEALVAILRPR